MMRVSPVNGKNNFTLQEMALKKVPIECASHTSLKGVARILKSDSAILKSLWCFGVVLFLAVCVQQCYIILEEYFSYPVITTISDKDVMFDGEHMDPFPTIEVCNHSPFSSEAKNIDDILSVDEYLELVDKAEMEAMNKTDIYPLNYTKQIFNIWSSPEGYFNYLKYSTAKRLGHQADIFIAKCSTINYFGSALYQQPCGDGVSITTRLNKYFLQCTQIQVPRTTTYVYGISLVLYTDGFKDPFHFKDWRTYLKLDMGIDRTSGTTIGLYHPQTDGFIQPADVIYVNPGETTDIRFKYQTITRLNKPYGICSMTLQDRTSKVYTRQACLANCQHLP